MSSLVKLTEKLQIKLCAGLHNNLGLLRGHHRAHRRQAKMHGILLLKGLSLVLHESQHFTAVNFVPILPCCEIVILECPKNHVKTVKPEGSGGKTSDPRNVAR